jgi:hypothetical protein
MSLDFGSRALAHVKNPQNRGVERVREGLSPTESGKRSASTQDMPHAATPTQAGTG